MGSRYLLLDTVAEHQNGYMKKICLEITPEPEEEDCVRNVCDLGISDAHATVSTMAVYGVSKLDVNNMLYPRVLPGATVRSRGFASVFTFAV